MNFITYKRYKNGNKVFKSFAADGNGTMDWCNGFKQHYAQEKVYHRDNQRHTENTAQLVHSRHSPLNYFIMNMIAAYCFFNNKPLAL